MTNLTAPELAAVAWRLVAQNLELEVCLPRLVEVGPVDLANARWSIRELVGDPPRLETTIAAGAGRSPARVALGAAELERLRVAVSGGPRTWASELFEDGGTRSSGDTAVIAELTADPFTILCVIGRFAVERTIACIEAVVEPLRAAVHNDGHVRELERLREAMAADNRALLSRLHRQDISPSIVGAESGLREVMERARQVASTDAPVLILGETGSGKEVVARSVHARSHRASGPFLRINCGAIPPELVDSELFGHERGSFTGAVSTRRGWFERADGGTLFLDEVGELPLAAQVRLLRVLQDGEFERVGGDRVLRADVRIVAATHRDMRSLIALGQFREDLWYRISVFPIVLPPLRDRVQDIDALSRHFAREAGLRLHGVELAPDPADITVLESYDWPGNVRELAAVIERAAILGGGHGLDVQRALGTFPRVHMHHEPTSLDGANRRTIEDALHRTSGRIEGDRGAAKLLDVHPATLRSRMRKLGIDWRAFRE